MPGVANSTMKCPNLGALVPANSLRPCAAIVPSFGSLASSLHQQIENLAFIVDRASEPELPARNYHGHLIEMYVNVGRGPRRSSRANKGSELQNPSLHRLVGGILPRADHRRLSVK